ncbi:autotransporter outer membrane beta-barrel domain-containing protein [Stakelama sp. CBK3Z-3]|uniref:Autotransporter outer membrane beta-barrel domain-containing protein n=1 Tax=Stakelama flava TaxID=2860338 RepID=A0ABS6XJ75_9SPHN|nr:autotransporter outer membrane beta-barrel domain-containing protein [Stakelama flava]MBW4330242.1 autotransporter outer membrane beta-barrel domain-containing protein [Stakelama flava]
MNIGSALRRRRLRTYALGTSAIALGMVLGGSAAAQCAPDPTVENGTTNCTGTDNDGLTITTYNTQVTVAADAVVNAGSSGAAITAQAPGTSISVAGTVNGASQPGIFITTGPARTEPCDPYAGASIGSCAPGSTVTVYPSVDASISVKEGGTVTGAQAILIRRASDASNSASAFIQNAGTITGTNGEAILADDTGFGAVSLSNAGTGLISGGVAGAISYVDNVGTINGTSRAAIAATSTVTVTNRGAILSDGTAATLSATGNLTVSNGEGATIGGSAIAIRTSGALSLTNAGTIDGSVISTASADQSSTVDTRTGIIDGDLLLGAGDDTLLALYDPDTGGIASITGMIDGGAGIDTITIGIDADATITQAVLPGNFERFGLDLSNNAIVTIAAEFTSASGLSLSGSGTVINRATLVTNGAAITSNGLGGLTFTNQGSVSATLDDSFLFAVDAPNTVNNRGTVTATGGGGISAASLLDNSGTIIASDTAAAVAYGTLTNSGMIRSTAGIGATLFSAGIESTNSGTIAGATTGLSLFNGTLANSGTISGGDTGVLLGGTLINTEQGTVTGSGAAVAVNGSSARVVNAGTINGDVDLAFPSSYDSNEGLFVDEGGTVNGAIRLGGGDDELVVTLGDDAGRPLAGATGGVDAGDGYDTLRYRVNADADAAIALTGGFEGLAYELSNDAALTLTASKPIATTIGLAGNGTVILNGAVSTTDRQLIDASIPTVAQLAEGTSGPERDLAIINNGKLQLATTSQSYNYGLAAIYAYDADITNNGTIAVSNEEGGYYPAAGIFGGTNVTNAGEIALSGGGIAVYVAQNVVNSGTITASGAGAVGVSGVGELVNSGIIRADGTAVQGGYASQSQISNSGTIESRLGTAIVLSGYDSQLVNETTGKINGAVAIDISSGGTIVNRGTIMGDVSAYAYSYTSTRYVADGGSLKGNLIFGAGQDMLVLFGEDTGVTGMIDGGDGSDMLVHARREDATVALGVTQITGFEREGVSAIGVDTQVTVEADFPFEDDLMLSGNGKIINTASITGAVTTSTYALAAALPESAGLLAAFTNQGMIDGGFSGTVGRFTNSGTVGGTALSGQAVGIYTGDALVFGNSGTIGNDESKVAVSLRGDGASTISATNSGDISGGVSVAMRNQTYEPVETVSLVTASLINSGSIGVASNDTAAVSINLDLSNDSAGSVVLTNSGTIEASGTGGVGASIAVDGYAGEPGAAGIEVTNSGTISANGGGRETVFDWGSQTFRYTDPAVGLALSAPDGTTTATVANSGTIEATGERSVAILAQGTALDLTNSGTIRGGGDTQLSGNDQLAYTIGTPYLASAIQTIGSADDRVVNTGSIIGSVALGAGDDRVENYGSIEGDVFLGEGDDSFVQLASALLTGTVDGGSGDDSLIIDATGGGAVNGDQFVNFDRFSQIGEGDVEYSGDFTFDTIGLSGGTISVAAGETLASAGDTTITGSDGAETLDNRGTIMGGVALGGGADRIDNRGAILGPVSLGSGDDVFVDYAGSSAGSVDGGSGIDLYQVPLSGDRSGIGQRTNFERLAVEGRGTLSLVLDQRFDQISLSGTGLNLSLDEWSVGRVTGSDAAETLAVDGDIATVRLGGGDDDLALGGVRGAGSYDGGEGSDTLRFTAEEPVLLTGTATGFEQVVLAGHALTVTGTLGSVGAQIGFGDDAQQITVADGGALAGVIDLGGGDDAFVLAAGSVLDGTVSGGAGTDSITLELAGDSALSDSVLSNFELLTSTGEGTLTFTGTHAYQSVTAGTDLSVALEAVLSAEQVTFGARDDSLTIAGRFNGSVDGGAGSDTVTVSGGSASAPVAFANVTNIEAFAQTGGFVTLSGNALLGTLAMSGGRFVGLAGSTLSARQIVVEREATFGSAGTVNGDIAVAGTLSPGASVATMTVNGNVELASGSVSLFEVDSVGADQLQVNGSVAIDQGATLQLVNNGEVQPGTSYDLIVATDGITGSYSTIMKPDSLFGFVVQRADRIQLLGEFLGDAGFSPQVSRSIDYANETLQVQSATSSLFDALPALVDENGASDPQAFARLTPEAYATATQAGIDNALTLVGAARGPAFTTENDAPGLFIFGQALGQWHTLGADQVQGTAKAQTHGYGFLGGIGYGDATFAVGAFGGYLNTRQMIDTLGTRTKNDGFVAGIHVRYASNGFGLAASILYDGGDARTTRALPDRTSATGRYGLHSWVSDLSGNYAIGMGKEWALNARAGVNYMRTNRGSVAEAGGPFALDVASDSHTAGFVDGGIMVARNDTSPSPFRPFVALGVRYQFDGRRTDALASYAGGPFSLEALGAGRARAVGTASAGLSYRLTSGVDLFSTASAQIGRDDQQETISTGFRVRF